MISIGDLVECEDMKRPWRAWDNSARATHRPSASAHWLGLVFKVKTQSLDGINEEKMFKIHFPNREQYWIPTDKLNKIA